MIFNAKIEEFEEGTGFILPPDVIKKFNLKNGDDILLTRTDSGLELKILSKPE